MKRHGRLPAKAEVLAYLIVSEGAMDLKGTNLVGPNVVEVPFSEELVEFYRNENRILSGIIIR